MRNRDWKIRSAVNTSEVVALLLVCGAVALVICFAALVLVEWFVA